MINIQDPKDCCGCSACAERCPRCCITMQPDEEGFVYPKVNQNECINCNLCDSVCPIINENISDKPISVIAAKNMEDDIRKQSSSGGVFTALAEKVIREGGVVFGVCFDEYWQVIHSYTETSDGLTAFRGSKYVQSNMGNCYRYAEQFLKDGRTVLFSGTPCQIAGLKSFLRKEYENLLTVDIICHGVPSPLVWSRYVETLRPKDEAGENSVSSLKNKSVITDLFFRDKRAGWRKYGFSAWCGATGGSDENTVFPSEHKKRIKYEILQQNVFMRGFLQHLYLRPSCHSCKFRNFKSKSDLTLGDFWGVKNVCPEFDDDMGVSIVIEKNNRMTSYLENNIISITIPENSYGKAFKGNTPLFRDSEPNDKRNIFWRDFLSRKQDIVELIKAYTVFSNKQMIRSNIVIALTNLHLYKFVNYIISKIR